MTGREVQLVSYPRGEVRPSDFRVVEVDVPRAGPGEVLVRNTWTSVDAALRLRLRAKAPAGYFAAFPLEAPMEGIMTVGEIVESHADGFDAGRHGLARVRLARLRGRRGRAAGARRRRDADEARHVHRAAAGVPRRARRNGLTAYAGLFRVAACATATSSGSPPPPARSAASSRSSRRSAGTA